MVTPETVHITAVIVFSAVLILAIILFHDLRGNLKQISSNNIKNTTIICILSIIALSLLFVIWNSVKYAALISPNDDQYFFKSLSNIILEFRITSGIINFIAVAYFMTITLEHVYKDTFLSINKPFINVCFIVYVITIIFWYIMLSLVHISSLWYPRFTQEPYQTLLTISTMAFSIISISSEIYFILILILFNMKLFKFISLTMKNNEILSLEINTRFRHFIIKQTNLISIITIAFIIFQIIAYWRWVESVTDNVVNLLYPVLFTLQQSIYAICIYLTFKFNNKYYKICCKYSHYFCVYSCTKLTKQNIRQPKYLSLSSFSNNRRCRADDEDDREENVILTYCIIDKCPEFAKIFAILGSYKDRMDDKIVDQYNISDILNAFHHLLQCHDSEDDFRKIHEKLNPECHSSCNYEDCQIFSRHYSRRRRYNNKTNISSNDDEEKYCFDDDRKYYSMSNIFDKLHAFYYHSYDTFARIKLSRKFVDEDDKISQLHKMVKGRRDSSILFTNKFNSDLNIEALNDNTESDNIYSFGERFEYEHKASEWFVERKYETLKSEFIDNEICNITIDEYQIEYNKSTEYMKTNQVKMIKCNEEHQGIDKSLSIQHILSLLVYCNCDYFQTKWSETFRKIPYNETNQSLKNRHSYFYQCSKFLRDLIEYFGSSLINMDPEHENKTFYHGVKQLLYFTRTITKFNAPLSTSTEATVALKFSGNIGVVLELKYSSSTYLLHAKYFDCAFFSDFVNEKECLFVGGVPMMIIANIINVSNGEIYRKYINVLNIINCMLNGTMERDNKSNNSNYDFTDNSVKLCCSLLSYQLMKNRDDIDDNEFPEYIVNLLNRYCVYLNHVMVFWHHMEMVEKLKNLLCSNKNDASFFDLAVLLKLFPNLEQIEYFNKSSKSKLKSTIQQIIDEVSTNQQIQKYSNLKYIIIHHQGSYKHKNNDHSNDEWNVFQDDSKVIIFQKDHKKNINLLNFRFNQIIQANASKSMIENLF